jgi:hypothetical protein
VARRPVPLVVMRKRVRFSDPRRRGRQRTGPEDLGAIVYAKRAVHGSIVVDGRSAVFEHGQRSRGMLRNEDPVQCDPFQAYYQRVDIESYS